MTQTLDDIQSTPRGQYDLVWSVYDLHRTVLLNAHYYGDKLASLQWWNKVFEIAIALSTSATVGAAFKSSWLIPYLAGTAAVLGVLKPIVNLSKSVERASKLWSSYTTLSVQTGRAVREIQLYHHVSAEMNTMTLDAQGRIDELLTLDDPRANMKRLKHFQALVNEELPADSLWSPT